MLKPCKQTGRGADLVEFSVSFSAECDERARRFTIVMSSEVEISLALDNERFLDFARNNRSRNAMNPEIDCNSDMRRRDVVVSPLGEGERMKVRGSFDSGKLNPRLAAVCARPTNPPI